MNKLWGRGPVWSKIRAWGVRGRGFKSHRPHIKPFFLKGLVLMVTSEDLYWANNVIHLVQNGDEGYRNRLLVWASD